MKNENMTLPQLKKKAWRLFSLWIRDRDAVRTTNTTNFVECITCGSKKPMGKRKVHAGHWISRIYTPTLFEETNVHAQCVSCNKWGEGEPEKHRRAIIKLYGEDEPERLYQLSKKNLSSDEARELYISVIEKYS